MTTPKTAKKTAAKKPAPKKVAQKKPEHPLMLNGKDWDKPKVMDFLCEQIATSSLGIASILKAGYHGEDLPSYSSIMAWIDADPALLEKYARAKEDQADFMADEMLDISDNQAVQVVLTQDEDGKNMVLLDHEGNPVKVTTATAVQHAKLRVDTRKWLASKLKPKKYGDKVQNELSGPDGGPIEHSLAVEFVNP